MYTCHCFVCFSINCLVAVCILQVYMMWNFITFLQRRRRELALEEAPSRKSLASSGGAADSPKSKPRVHRRKGTRSAVAPTTAATHILKSA